LAIVLSDIKREVVGQYPRRQRRAGWRPRWQRAARGGARFGLAWSEAV